MIESWGMVLTLACFALFSFLQKKTGKIWLNPLLMTAMFIGFILMKTGIPYSQYKESSSILTWLLFPATVSLAVPMYEQLDLLKKNFSAIITGITAGTLTGLACTVVLVKLFNFDFSVGVSFLPKSVTTAIGTEISAELGGIPSVTTVLIILTGIGGNMMAGLLCRLFRLRDGISRGVAIGTCSHAIGTAKALEMGQTEGAMSSLSIAVAGIITAILAPLVSKLL